MPTTPPIPVIAAESLVVLEFEHSHGLGFIADDTGLVVSCLHVMVGEAKVKAKLAHGQTAEVTAVRGIDARRDLCTFKVPHRGTTLLPPPQRLAAEGSKVYVFGLTNEGPRLQWTEARIGTISVLGGWLTAYRLEGELPPDASGGPLVSEQGELLGVVTVAETDEGTIALGVPWKYVVPLLEETKDRPLAALVRQARRVPKRQVPEHSLQLLEGSDPQGLETVLEEIAGAIQSGAPAYNDGDVEKCYRIYADTARRLVQMRTDCPGAQRALQQGLERAAQLADTDSQAWAMRDTFDGLLVVIEKWFRAHAGGSTPPAGKPRPPPLLN